MTVSPTHPHQMTQVPLRASHTRSPASLSDPVSTERTAPKRKFPSPPHSSNGHSPQDSSTSPIKKKKKPGLLNSTNKEQVNQPPCCFCTRGTAARRQWRSWGSWHRCSRLPGTGCHLQKGQCRQGLCRHVQWGFRSVWRAEDRAVCWGWGVGWSLG